MEILKSELEKIVTVLSESTKDIVICLNSDLKILFINLQAKKVYGNITKLTKLQSFDVLCNGKNSSCKLINALRKRQFQPIRETLTLRRQKIPITWSITYSPSNKRPQFILLCGKNVINKQMKVKDLSNENAELKNYIANIVDVIPGNLPTSALFALELSKNHY